MRSFLPFCLAAALWSAACNNNTSGSADIRKDSIAPPSLTLQRAKPDDKPALPAADTSTAFINTADSPFVLVPHPVHLKKGVNLNLNIPEGYNISVAYEGLNRL